MLQGRNGENIIQVQVDTKKLLETLKKNRETHIADYQKARIAFKEAAIKKAKAALKDAEGINLDKKDLATISFHITPPVEYTKEYDRAIGMLSLHTEPNITIDSGSYSKFVDDEWEWKNTFRHSNESYALGG